MTVMSETCGIITFFSSSHALHAEKVLKAAGMTVELIPGPKDISPNCGVALRCDFAMAGQAKELLASGGVTYEAFHCYTFPQRRSLMDKLLGR